MSPDRREEIRRALSALTESYAATMRVMEQTLALLCDELSLDPRAYFQAWRSSPEARPGRHGLVVDHALFTVTFRGKPCFLGNGLPFRLLDRLARSPGAFVSYEDLLADVWQGRRTDDAVRSVVKSLRRRLRRAGLAEVADAVDGSASGHHALRLGR
jgi:DNA-binding response OmpR family regulator